MGAGEKQIPRSARDDKQEILSEKYCRVPLQRRLCRRFGAAEVGGFDGVAHEHGDGHGADAAGDGSQRTGGVHSVRMNVADEHGTLLAEFCESLREIFQEFFGFEFVGDFVRADVNNGGAGFEPVGFDVTGFAHRSDDDVRATNDVWQVARFGVADGDGGVRVHQEKSHRLADDVAAAENDGVGAFDGDIVAAKNFHAAGGGASDEAFASADEFSEIDGMKTVDVFRGVDGFENFFGIDLFGQGKLDEDAVHAVVTVEIVNEF